MISTGKCCAEVYVPAQKLHWGCDRTLWTSLWWQQSGQAHLSTHAGVALLKPGVDAALPLLAQGCSRLDARALALTLLQGGLRLLQQCPLRSQLLLQQQTPAVICLLYARESDISFSSQHLGYCSECYPMPQQAGM